MISIIVPVYRGGDTLEALLSRIVKVFRTSLKNQLYEVIFVDDCSPDESYKVIEKLSSAHDHVHGIGLSKNAGQQNATYCGMHFAKGDVIVTMDDDLQHEPELLPVLLAKLNDNTDLVYGVSIERTDGRYRKLGSKLTAQFFKHMFKNLGSCRVSSFRVFKKHLNEHVIDQKTGFVYISCLLLSKCRGVENVLIPFTPRVYGRSNYNYKKLIDLFMKLYLNYGPLNRMYKRLNQSNKLCFLVGKVTYHSNQGESMHENYDVGRRHQSVVCH